MKKCLLPGMVILLSSGCIEVNSGDVSITPKDGVLCFDVENEAEARNDKIQINSILVYEVGTQPVKVLMNKDFLEKPLQPGNCIPYEGVPFENNILYGVDLGIFIEHQRANVMNDYSGTFCFSKKKNGEKVFHHFKNIWSERPSVCPVASDE